MSLNGGISSAETTSKKSKKTLTPESLSTPLVVPATPTPRCNDGDSHRKLNPNRSSLRGKGVYKFSVQFQLVFCDLLSMMFCYRLLRFVTGRNHSDDIQKLYQADVSRLRLCLSKMEGYSV